MHLALEGLHGVLTLDQPERRNALSGRMLAELGDAVEALENWDGVTLLVQGAGGYFCAGADLKMVSAQGTTAADAVVMGAYVRQVLTRLRRLPVVSVAAVEGGALGGGAELTTACDHRVLAADATLRFVQVSLGVCTGWGGGSRLVRMLGRARAMRLLGTAEPINAQQALDLGLADRLAPSGEAARVAAGLLASYRTHPPQAVRAMKAVVAAADDAPLDTALAVEAEAFESLWGSGANKAALARKQKKKKKR